MVYNFQVIYMGKQTNKQIRRQNIPTPCLQTLRIKVILFESCVKLPSLSVPVLKSHVCYKLPPKARLDIHVSVSQLPENQSVEQQLFYLCLF